MRFENITQYNKAALRALSNVASRTVQRRRCRLRRGFLLVLGTLCLVCGGLLLLIFRELDGSDKVIGLTSFLVGLLALAEGIFYRRFLAWNVWRTLPESRGERYFLFAEDFIQAERPGMEAKYRYETLLGAYETVGYFVLFLDRQQGMVLDKAGFRQFMPEDFRTFLAKKLGKPVELVV